MICLSIAIIADKQLIDQMKIRRNGRRTVERKREEIMDAMEEVIGGFEIPKETQELIEKRIK